MQRLNPSQLFPFLMVIWTSIFLFFWAIVEVGGNALSWIFINIFGAPADRAELFFSLLQNVGMTGLVVIWLMGAAGLFIMRRWLRVLTQDPGDSYEVKVQHDGKTIESSATDVTEKR